MDPSQTAVATPTQDGACEGILEGLWQATGHLLSGQTLTDENLTAALSALGQAADVDRAYIFEHIPGAGTHSTISLRYEWSSDGVAPRIDEPESQGPWWSDVAARWYDAFAEGRSIAGDIADFPAGERAALDHRGVLSLLALPIEVNGTPWGFIEFDSIRARREWTFAEIGALRSMTNSVAIAIGRLRAEQALRESESRFRQAEVDSRDALAAMQDRLSATIDGLPDPHVLLEPIRDEDHRIIDYTYTDANEAASEYMGLQIDALVGKRLRDVMPGPTGTAFLALCAATSETGTPLVADDFIFPGLGYRPKRWHDVRAVRFGAALSLTWHDVTEYHHIEGSLRRTVEELNALQRISQLLARGTDPRDAFGELSLEIAALLQVGDVHVHLLPRVGAAAAGGVPTTPTGMSYEDIAAPEAAVLRQVLATGKPVMARSPGVRMRSMLGVPMIAHSRTIGVLFAESEDQGRHFKPGDLKLAGTAADLLAAAVQNAHLRDVEMRQAAVDERQYLARDLHDAVTQSIYSANLIAEALPTVWKRSPEEAMRSLLALRRLVRAALAELRTLLYELRPIALEQADLATLLERLGDAFRGQADIAIDIAVPACLELPTDVKVAFYRIAQESLSNVDKHARASHVSVSVVDDGRLVRLEVRDDGKGFAREDVPLECFGLSIMRGRADEIGADFAIQSDTGSGTTVDMVWHRPAAESS